MHHIYRTKAIILSSSAIKEADKQLNLLTEDFGFIRAVAQGVRKEESKLRFSTQDFSVADLALVSGRGGWRLTNAKIIFSISDELNNSNLLKIVARIFNLLERFLIAESDDRIFDLTLNFIKFLIREKNKVLHINQLNSLESIFVTHLLSNLGYLDLSEIVLIYNKNLDIEMINSLTESEVKNINKLINQAIRKSGL